MGSDDGEDDERPSHVVQLDEFLIGRAAGHATRNTPASFARSGHRAPAIHELPLVVTAGGGEREDAVPADRRALRLAGSAAATASGSIIP